MSQIIGHISQVIGPVVDVYFEGTDAELVLPSIHDALEIKRPNGKILVVEVQQHIGKYGESIMFLGDIIDKLLDQYGFSHTGTTEQTDFTTFGIRLEQVDYFDTREEDLLHSCQILKFRGVAVNRIRTFAVESFHKIGRAHV